MHATATVFSINVNPEGGVPKYAVPAADITVQGVRGDKQNDLEHHGGPERAVSLYAYERIQDLQNEGHPIAVGTTGENLTLVGLPWAHIQPGDQLAIGERVVLEITRPVAPCHKIAASFVAGEFKRMSDKVHPGWSRLYARVVVEGTVRQGDPVDWVVGETMPAM